MLGGLGLGDGGDGEGEDSGSPLAGLMDGASPFGGARAPFPPDGAAGVDLGGSRAVRFPGGIGGEAAVGGR